MGDRSGRKLHPGVKRAGIPTLLWNGTNSSKRKQQQYEHSIMGIKTKFCIKTSQHLKKNSINCTLKWQQSKSFYPKAPGFTISTTKLQSRNPWLKGKSKSGIPQRKILLNDKKRRGPQCQSKVDQKSTKLNPSVGSTVRAKSQKVRESEI